MDILYKFVELFATFGEGFIAFYTVTFMSGSKYSPKKTFGFQLLNCLIYTTIITFLNTLSVFSFSTLVIALFLIWILTYLTSSNSFLFRAMATTLSILIITSLDYVIGFSCAILIGKSTNIYAGFILIMKSGLSRTLYTFFNKSIQLIILFLLAPYYQRLNILKRKQQCYLFIIIIIIALIISTLLINMIFSESPMISQTSIIASWLFILTCVCAIIIAFYSNTQYKLEKEENELIASTNYILESSYLQIADKIESLHSQAHDYKKHLLTIRHLGLEDAYEYIDSLLDTEYHPSLLCRTGDKYIDAILNCKKEEAEAKQISFTYSANLPQSLSIASVDICAILSNQLDNAIEACCKISDPRERYVHVTLDQKLDFFAFIVKNSIVHNSLSENDPLISTKLDSDHPHGFGLKNIRTSVEKYGGTLSHTITSTTFTSTALIQLPYNHLT